MTVGRDFHPFVEVGQAMRSPWPWLSPSAQQISKHRPRVRVGRGRISTAQGWIGLGLEGTTIENGLGLGCVQPKKVLKELLRLFALAASRLLQAKKEGSSLDSGFGT
jgi:hypothetical protein